MFPSRRRLAGRMRELACVSLTGLQGLFRRWVCLPPEMDHGVRKRISFPLAIVLALSFAGVRGGWVVSRSAAEIPVVVGGDRAAHGLAQNRRLLCCSSSAACR